MKRLFQTFAEGVYFFEFFFLLEFKFINGSTFFNNFQKTFNFTYYIYQNQILSMTKDQLIARLGDIEWEDFEVKEASTKIPKNTWETVSAFSNTAGGWLIFGIRLKGKSFEIVGVENPEKIEQDFTTTLRGEKFNDKIRPVCKKYDFDEGTVLAFYIPLSNKKPIYFGAPLNTFLRTASGDQRATREEVDAMYRDQAFGTRTSVTIPEFDDTSINNHSVERYRDYMSRFNPSHSYNKLTRNELLSKLQIVEDGK